MRQWLADPNSRTARTQTAPGPFFIANELAWCNIFCMKLSSFSAEVLKRMSLATGRSHAAIIERLCREEFVRECVASKLDPEPLLANWRAQLPEVLSRVAVMDPGGIETHAAVRAASGLKARACAAALRAAGAEDANMHLDGKTYRAWRGIRLR